MPSQITLQTASGTSLIEYIIAGNNAASAPLLAPVWTPLGDSAGGPPGVTQTLTCLNTGVPFASGTLLIFTVNGNVFPATSPSPTISGVADDLGMGNVWLPMFSQLNFLNDKLAPPRDAAFQVFYTNIQAPISASTTFHITVTFGGSCGIFDMHSFSMGQVGTLDQVVTNIFDTDINSVPIGSITTGTNALIMTFIALWDVAASGRAQPPGTLVIADTPSLAGSATAVYNGLMLVSPPGNYSATWTMGTGTLLNNAGALVSFL